ncbi:MAG: DUF2797 domain-containing protein [Methylococcales bacterium]|nr:DUF2797 domain-containing protein [Methylococcales bacterium]
MQGSLKKMRTHLENGKVQYQLPVGAEFVDLNSLIGKSILFKHTGRITCIECQKTTKKSFNQGYCYPCFIKLAQCDMCIMKPETCHYAAGTCREPAWGEEFCFQPHFIYLANSSGIKVGITRHTQVPTRWIDQGAVQALPIFQVPTRQLSGLVEVIFAKHISDKTSWQQMLKSQAEPIDLVARRDELIALCADDLAALKTRFSDSEFTLLSDAEVLDINYPIAQYPVKVKSFNMDKDPEVAGVLQGIKGQYLLLDTGVINIRKYTGYEIDFND